MELDYPCGCILDIRMQRWGPPFDTNIKSLCADHKQALKKESVLHLDLVHKEVMEQVKLYLEKVSS